MKTLQSMGLRHILLSRIHIANMLFLSAIFRAYRINIYVWCYYFDVHCVHSGWTCAEWPFNLVHDIQKHLIFHESWNVTWYTFHIQKYINGQNRNFFVLEMILMIHCYILYLCLAMILLFSKRWEAMLYFSKPNKRFCWYVNTTQSLVCALFFTQLWFDVDKLNIKGK